MKPKRGAIAVCSAGCLGVITCDEPQEVTYPNGDRALAWTGFHLRDDPGMGHRIGSLWSSRNPEVQGHVDDVTTALLFVYPNREALEASNGGS